MTFLNNYFFFDYFCPILHSGIKCATICQFRGKVSREKIFDIKFSHGSPTKRNSQLQRIPRKSPPKKLGQNNFLVQFFKNFESSPKISPNMTFQVNNTNYKNNLHENRLWVAKQKSILFVTHYPIISLEKRARCVFSQILHFFQMLYRKDPKASLEVHGTKGRFIPF